MLVSCISTLDLLRIYTSNSLSTIIVLSLLLIESGWLPIWRDIIVCSFVILARRWPIITSIAGSVSPFYSTTDRHMITITIVNITVSPPRSLMISQFPVTIIIVIVLMIVVVILVVLLRWIMAVAIVVISSILLMVILLLITLLLILRGSGKLVSV